MSRSVLSLAEAVWGYGVGVTERCFPLPSVPSVLGSLSLSLCYTVFHECILSLSPLNPPLSVTHSTQMHPQPQIQTAFSHLTLTQIKKKTLYYLSNMQISSDSPHQILFNKWCCSTHTHTVMQFAVLVPWAVIGLGSPSLWRCEWSLWSDATQRINLDHWWQQLISSASPRGQPRRIKGPNFYHPSICPHQQ